VLPNYKLVSRQGKAEDTIIKLGDCAIGGGKPVVIAGPCAVEEEEMMVKLACKLKRLGVHILRGGAYKPRTSPYSFQGLGVEGLRILADAGRVAGMPVVTELTDITHLSDAKFWAIKGSWAAQISGYVKARAVSYA